MTRKKKAVFQIVLIICGITMLCYGALRGEAETVLSKAIRLCWSVWELDNKDLKKKRGGVRSFSHAFDGLFKQEQLC